MLHTCPHCGLVFYGLPCLDVLGWHVACPECTGSFDVDLDPASPGEKMRAAIEKARNHPNQSSPNAAYLHGYADALKDAYRAHYYHISCGDPETAVWEWLTEEETKAHRAAGYTLTR